MDARTVAESTVDVMLRVSIPEHLWDVDIDALGLSRRARNCLLSRGLKTLGSLHGLSAGDIGGLRGVGALTLDEIISALAAVTDGVHPLLRQMNLLEEADPRNADAAECGPTGGTPRISVPPDLREWPVTAVPVPEKARGALHNQGITTLGELHGLSHAALVRFEGIGAKAANAIIRALDALQQLPAGDVLRVDDTGRTQPPAAPLQLFRSVAKAETPAEEIAAVLSTLSPRNAELVRLRWTRNNGRQATLEHIADLYGVTRERVRQIVTKHDSYLATSNLRLPRTARVVELLQAAGGALPESELQQRSTEAGVPADAAVFSCLEALGQLRLVPPVTYNAEYDVWVTAPGAKEWLESGRLRAVMIEFRRAVRRSLHQSGCIADAVLNDSPFGREHAEGLAARGGLQLRQVGSYRLPIHPADSVLTRWVRQMLTITPELSLDELAVGLRRTRVMDRKRRRRIDVPPSSVLGEVLRSHPQFEVRGDEVRLREPAARETVFTPTECVVIDAIERNGNVASWTQIMGAAEIAGCAFPTAALVLQGSYIARKGPSLYALRGRPIDPAVLRDMTRERAALRRESVKSVLYTGGTQARVVYALTTFSVRGVLPLPAKLRGLAIRNWRARLPGGRELRVKMRGGFIWSFSKWIRDDRLKVGDLIVATFMIPDGIIELDTVS